MEYVLVCLIYRLSLSLILDCFRLDPFCTTCYNASICLTCSGGKLVYGATCVVSCPEGYYNSYGTCIPRSTSSLMQETAGQILSSTMTVGSFLLFGSSQSLTAGLLAKIIAYIRYIDIDYSAELKDLLQQDSNLVALDIIPELPETIKERIPSATMPYMFEEYELEASFLANFWTNLFGITIAFIIFMISIVLQGIRKRRKQGKIFSLINKLYFAAMNFLIVQIYCSFDEITLFFILQMRFLSFDSILSYLSLVLSLFFTALGLVSLFVHTWIIKKYQQAKVKCSGKNQKEMKIFMQKYEGLSLLFKDFKDITSLHQSYLLIFIIRNILANVLLGTTDNYPFVQTSFFVAFSLLLMGYIVIKRPFKEFFDLLEQIFYEGIILVANITVFIMSIKQNNDTLQESKESLGKVIIILSLTCNIGALVLVLLRLFTLLITTIHEWRKKRLKKKKEGNIISNAIGEYYGRKVIRRGNQLLDEHRNISTLGNLNNVTADINVTNINDDCFFKGL